LQQSKRDYWIRELWNAKPYGYNDKIDSICNGEYKMAIFVKTKFNNLLKKAIDQYIQGMIQVFQIWHMFRADEYVNF
jgi:hypothetical protein